MADSTSPNFDEGAALKEYKLKNPEGWEVTLTYQYGAFQVDMWKPDGENHWNRSYKTQAEAETEYNRWAKD